MLFLAIFRIRIVYYPGIFPHCLPPHPPLLGYFQPTSSLYTHSTLPIFSPVLWMHVRVHSEGGGGKEGPLGGLRGDERGAVEWTWNARLECGSANLLGGDLLNLIACLDRQARRLLQIPYRFHRFHRGFQRFT